MTKALLLSAMMFAVVLAAPTLKSPKEDVFILCDGSPADIFFLLDSSSSIWIEDYKKQLKFIQQIVDYFPVSATETRFGVGVFADHYRQEIGFDDFDNAADLKTAIGGIRKRLGGTETGRALKKVRKQAFSQARPGVGHVLVVLTDGVSRNTEETKKAAAALRAQGIHVFAIGIGKKSDMPELESIGSKPKETYVHNVTDFSVLNKIREKLAFQVCKVEAPKHEPYCSAGMKTDVMFAYDASGMGTQNARRVQDFIGDTIQNFANMDDGTIQTGVLSGQCDRDNVDLNVFSDKNSMASFVRNSDFRGVDEIVRDLHENSYEAARGGRETARRMSVVIVDENVEKIKQLETEMKIAKSKKDIQFVVISIGDSSLFDGLRKLVTKPAESHFFNVPSHRDIDTIKGQFIDSLCEGFKVPAPKGPNKIYYDNFNDIVPISNLIIES